MATFTSLPAAFLAANASFSAEQSVPTLRSLYSLETDRPWQS